MFINLQPLFKIKAGVDKITEKKEINVEIGRRIKLAREKIGYTQEKFAEKIDRSVQYVSDLERGKVGASIQTPITDPHKYL